jgi:hypothetical protein
LSLPFLFLRAQRCAILTSQPHRLLHNAVEGEGKAVPVHVIKACRWWSTAPLILKFRAKWSWVVNFTPRPLYLRKRTRNRSLCGHHKLSGPFEEQNNTLPLQGFKPPTVQSVA